MFECEFGLNVYVAVGTSKLLIRVSSPNAYRSKYMTACRFVRTVNCSERYIELQRYVELMGPKASVLHFIMPIRDVFNLCIVPYCYERLSSVLCETWITVSKIVILRQMCINHHSYV